jgi:adenylate cyclase
VNSRADLNFKSTRSREDVFTRRLDLSFACKPLTFSAKRVSSMRVGRVHGRLRLLFFGFVGLGAVALSVLTYSFGIIDDFDRQTIDTRFELRGAQPTRSDVIVVKIDDVTFDELDQRWPFPRSLHAKLLDRIKADGPRAIAFDIQVTEPTTPAEDNALIEAVGRNRGHIVLSTTQVGPHGETGIFGGGSILQQIGAKAGSGNFHTDRGGIVRQVSYEIGHLKTLSIATAESASGRRISPSELGRSRAWIDFAGPPGTIPSVSYSRVLRGKVPASTFRNKIVVVGATAPLLQDIHATSTGTGMPGPEVQANAIWTALHGFPLRSAGTAMDIVLIVLLGLLAPALSLRMRPLYAISAAVIAGALFTVLVQAVFNGGWIVSFVYPMMALALSTVGSLGSYYLVTAVERERVRDVFSRFVPEGVVDQVLSRADGDLRLGGQKLTATILFADLRGFTSAVEHLEAEDVILLLNYYLGEMSEAILTHGGTLVSYMGDGIMAAFGAPIERPDHADRAFAAAREMLQDRLPRFNAWVRERGLSEGLRMGVGLNTGNVMSGNVGHERRVEYTTVGDTTNTAARLEGMTKGTPYMLFVAETTYAALSSVPDGLVFVDEFEIRGRVQGLKVWGYVPVAKPAEAPEPVEAPAAGLAIP